MLEAVGRYGISGAATAIAAGRDPDGVALIDERGPLTFGELDRRTNALAPRDVLFVDALPRNAGGNVLKRVLVGGV